MFKVNNFFKLFVLCLPLCLFVSVPCLEAAENSLLLVLPFKNLSQEQEIDWLGEGLAGGINYYLEPMETIKIISRERLQKKINPSSMEELRVVDIVQVRALAKQLGARWVVIGSYQRTQMEKYKRGLFVVSHLIEVNSDEAPLLLRGVKGETKHMFSWQRQIVVKLLDHLGGELNEFEKSFLNTVPTTSLLAYEYYHTSWQPFFSGEYKKALRWCQKATITDINYEAPLLRMAVIHEKLGQLEEAIKMYLSLQDLWKQANRVAGMQKLHDKLGVLYLELGQNNHAMKSFQRSLELLEAGESLDAFLIDLADVYAKIALTHCNKKEYVNGVKYYEKTLEIQKQIGDKRVIAGTYSKIGDIYYAKGLYVSAVKNYKKAFSVWKQIEDKHGLAATYNKLGVVYSQRKKNQKKALKAFSNALRLARKSEDKSLMMQIYKDMGRLYLVDLKYDKAMKFYKNALTLGEELDDSRVLVEVYTGIGKVYRRESKDRQALEYCQKALILQKELKLETDRADTLAEVAGIYFKQEKYDQAIEYFSKALGLQTLLDNREQLAFIHKNLGAIHAQMQLYQKALGYYLKGLELERSLQDFTGQAGTYYRIAQIYEKMQQHEKAINYMKKTVALDRKTNDPNLHSDERYLHQIQQQLKSKVLTNNAVEDEGIPQQITPVPTSGARLPLTME